MIRNLPALWFPTQLTAITFRKFLLWILEHP